MNPVVVVVVVCLFFGEVNPVVVVVCLFCF